MPIIKLNSPTNHTNQSTTLQATQPTLTKLNPVDITSFSPLHPKNTSREPRPAQVKQIPQRTPSTRSTKNRPIIARTGAVRAARSNKARRTHYYIPPRGSLPIKIQRDNAVNRSRLRLAQRTRGCRRICYRFSQPRASGPPRQKRLHCRRVAGPASSR